MEAIILIFDIHFIFCVVSDTDFEVRFHDLGALFLDWDFISNM